jgi:protein-L-isoaspartate(D-aspartate) O-methyltransferase
MLDFAQARRIMVDSQLRPFDVNDIPLLDAMNTIPRERFVAPGRESLAYMDQDIPVADGRRMLSPMIAARMIQNLEVRAGERVLDVACGLLEQGYAEGAPYDAILVNGALEVQPDGLLRQLSEGGRLVCVQGRGRAAKAMLYVRAGDALSQRSLFDAAAPVLAAFRDEPGFVF